jgi:phosphoribosylpyrophosphate synthetase
MVSKKFSNNKRKKSLIKKHLGGMLTEQQLAVLGHSNQLSLEKFVILSCPEFDYLADSLIQKSGGLFLKGNVGWKKYNDGTPKMVMDEHTVKMLRGRHVIYLAYFSFNEPNSTNILSQYMFLSSLASYGINKLHIILPYYPTGTMERIQVEGELGTGYYLAHFFNSIPCGNSKNELYVIDMHALCTRFFFHTNIKMTFITMFNKYAQIISDKPGISFVVFPDDGAEKRNKELCKLKKIKFITCAKIRVGDKRFITITGDISTMVQNIIDNVQLYRTKKEYIKINLFIMDDLIQTGGTVSETINQFVVALKAQINTTNSDLHITDEEYSILINYILLITHSILPPPLTEPSLDLVIPTVDSVRDIFMNKLFFEKMQNIEYVTTDTRPFMKQILHVLNTEEGGPLQDRITIISIDDIILNVFTDINTQYITPYSS